MSLPFRVKSHARKKRRSYSFSFVNDVPLLVGGRDPKWDAVARVMEDADLISRRPNVGLVEDVG